MYFHFFFVDVELLINRSPSALAAKLPQPRAGGAAASVAGAAALPVRQFALDDDDYTDPDDF